MQFMGRVCLIFLAMLLVRASAAQIGEIESLGNGNTAFSMEIYAHLRTSQGNIAFSPYSVSLALLMAYAGAAGETARQIERALQFPWNVTNIHSLVRLLNS